MASPTPSPPRPTSPRPGTPPPPHPPHTLPRPLPPLPRRVPAVPAVPPLRTVPVTDYLLLVVAPLDPAAPPVPSVPLHLPALGLAPVVPFIAHDLVTGASWQWGEHNFVRLGPDGEPVHVIHIRRF